MGTVGSVSSLLCMCVYNKRETSDVIKSSANKEHVFQEVLSRDKGHHGIYTEQQTQEVRQVWLKE